MNKPHLWRRNGEWTCILRGVWDIGGIGSTPAKAFNAWALVPRITPTMERPASYTAGHNARSLGKPV